MPPKLFLRLQSDVDILLLRFEECLFLSNVTTNMINLYITIIVLCALRRFLKYISFLISGIQSESKKP